MSVSIGKLMKKIEAARERMSTVKVPKRKRLVAEFSKDNGNRGKSTGTKKRKDERPPLRPRGIIPNPVIKDGSVPANFEAPERLQWGENGEQFELTFRRERYNKKDQLVGHLEADPSVGRLKPCKCLIDRKEHDRWYPIIKDGDKCIVKAVFVINGRSKTVLISIVPLKKID